MDNVIIEFFKHLPYDVIAYETFRFASFALTLYFFGLWLVKEAYRQWHEMRADLRRTREFYGEGPKPVPVKAVVTTPRLVRDATMEAKQPAILNDYKSVAPNWRLTQNHVSSLLKDKDYAQYLEQLPVDDAKKN